MILLFLKEISSTSWMATLKHEVLLLRIFSFSSNELF